MVHLLEGLEILPQAKHAVISATGGWTTNLPLEELLRDDVLVAYEYDGWPISPEHGGPVRLLVPGCTSGRARSGCRASSSPPTNAWATGRSAATTRWATRGWSSATPKNSFLGSIAPLIEARDPPSQALHHPAACCRQARRTQRRIPMPPVESLCSRRKEHDHRHLRLASSSSCHRRDRVLRRGLCRSDVDVWTPALRPHRPPFGGGAPAGIARGPIRRPGARPPGRC